MPVSSSSDRPSLPAYCRVPHLRRLGRQRGRLWSVLCPVDLPRLQLCGPLIHLCLLPLPSRLHSAQKVIWWTSDDGSVELSYGVGSDDFPAFPGSFRFPFFLLFSSALLCFCLLMTLPMLLLSKFFAIWFTCIFLAALRSRIQRSSQSVTSKQAS